MQKVTRRSSLASTAPGADKSKYIGKLLYPIGARDVEHSGLGNVTFSLPGQTFTMPLEDFGYRLAAWQAQVTSPYSTLTEAVRGLIKTRDFLCLQLDHAWGNIPDDEFDERSTEYLKRTPIDDQVLLRQKVFCVITALGEPADAHTLASMFQCRIEEVEQALLPTGGEKLVNRR